MLQGLPLQSLRSCRRSRRLERTKAPLLQVAPSWGFRSLVSQRRATD